MEDEGFLYNENGFTKEWGGGEYLLVGNTGKNVQKHTMPKGINGVELLYGNSDAVSLQNNALSVSPGNTVALKLYTKKPMGLYKNGVMVTHLGNVSTASVAGKTTQTDLYFVVYSENEKGVEELLYIEMNPASVNLSRWHGKKVRIQLFHWEGLQAVEKAYTGFID